MPTEQEKQAARERVAEFVRQWEIPKDRTGDISSVLFDPTKDEPAYLTVADLKILLGETS